MNCIDRRKDKTLMPECLFVYKTPLLYMIFMKTCKKIQENESLLKIFEQLSTRIS